MLFILVELMASGARQGKPLKSRSALAEEVEGGMEEGGDERVAVEVTDC